jgi:2-polyprenyl-6-methoxyphenol hydroxylase-like FAD-dependent oxidoreductase
MMDYDVIVVGARVAGSVLAALLGQFGHRVLVLDKANFPSDTLSTHFFREPALAVFERLGVFDAVKASAPPMTQLWNYIDGQVISEPVKADKQHLRFFLCSRRITLDWILIQRLVRESTIEFRQGAQVRELIWQDERVVGVSWAEAGQEYQATARTVVGADGFYSALAKLLQPSVENEYPVQRCMYFTYYQGLSPLDPNEALAEHHFLENTLTYVFPTGENLTLVALSLPISRFPAFRKEPLKNLQAHLGELPLLRPRLRAAKPVSEIRGAANIPGYQRVPYGPGWALVGDAQQVLDPWSGMGIDHATTHAGMLAEALHCWLDGDLAWDAAMSGYHQQIRKWSEKTYRRTCTNAADFRPMTRAALASRGL